MIEIKNLTKQYGTYKAVNNLSFEVGDGKMLGFLGVNGAGKSTTINMLSTILKHDGGEAIINGYALGKDDRKIRETIGVVYQQNVLDERLTVKENLSIRARLAGVDKIKFDKRLNELSRLLDLDEIRDKRYKVLSGGQKRRCEIAAALIHAPKILFLDEPTTGLDPATRIEVWNAVKSLREDKNMTVFLTTHYMEEAAAADQIVIIDKGVKMAEGTPIELKQKYAKDRLKIYFNKEKEEEIRKALSGCDFYGQAYGADITIKDSFESIDIVGRIRPYIDGFEVIAGNMDDVFLNVTKER